MNECFAFSIFVGFAETSEADSLQELFPDITRACGNSNFIISYVVFHSRYFVDLRFYTSMSVMKIFWDENWYHVLVQVPEVYQGLLSRSPANY